MEDFETYRPYLLSIAYRMTGSMSEAEDIVLDAYLRFSATSVQEIHSLKSYLSTTVTRLCLDYLKSARVQREQYIGPWLPEPLLTAAPDITPFETAAQHESISLAFLVLLETLSPPERAVFLLHDIFAFNYQEIAEIIGKESRQLPSTLSQDEGLHRRTQASLRTVARDATTTHQSFSYSLSGR